VKFALLLPLLQVGLAFALWEWPLPTQMPEGLDARFVSTPMLIGYGISAPAFLIKLLVLPFRRQTDYLPIWIGRFNIEDLIFFVGVFVLWLLVGRTLDRRMARGIRKAIGVGRALWDLALGASGVFLFGAGLQGILKPSTRTSVGLFTDAILFIVWGVVLIIIPGMELLNAIRRKYSRAVGQLPTEAPDGPTFPFSKPLFFLFVLTAIYTIGLSVLAAQAAFIQPPDQSRGLWTIIFGLILTWWVYADRVQRKFRLAFEFEYFVLFAWPIVVPYYLYRRLGRRGLLFGLGIWGLYVVPFVVAAFVFAWEHVHAHH
jgi:hypothetical protein